MKSGNLEALLVRLIVIFIPFNAIITVKTNYFSVGYLLTFVLALIVFARHAVSKKALTFKLHEVLLVLFSGFIGFSLLWGVEYREALKQFLGVFSATLFVLLIAKSNIDKNVVTHIETDIVWVGVGIAILSVLQISFGESFYPYRYLSYIANPGFASKFDLVSFRAGIRTGRAVGAFITPVELGVYFLLPYLVALNKCFRTRRFVWYIATVIILAGLFSTFSKGAYLLTIGGTLLFVWSNKMKKALIIVMLISTIIFASLVFERYGINLIKSVSTFVGASQGDDIFTNIRYYYWHESFKVFLASPVWGQGYSGVGRTCLTDVVGLDPHSSYLMILANQGLLGFGLFIALILMTIIRFLRVRPFASGLQESAFLLFMLYIISFIVDGSVFNIPYIYFLPVGIASLNIRQEANYIVDWQNRTQGGVKV